MKFRVGDDFKNLDSVSVISKGVIFLVLIPFIVVHTYHWVMLSLQNNFINSSSGNALFSLASFVAEFLSAAYNIYFSCLSLLFSMGYGVIYYHNGKSRHYRIFSKSTFTKISWFFVVNLVVLYIFMSSLNQPSTKYPFMSWFDNSSQSDSDVSISSVVFTVLVTLFSNIWLALTAVSYFETKKAIAKSPPFQKSSHRIVLAFKKSIYIILVSSIVVIFGNYISEYKRSQKMTQVSLPKEPIGRSKDYESVVALLRMENSLQDLLSPILITNWVCFFVPVVFIFFIWVKDNNGLIIDRNGDDPTEKVDV
ncbi:hypothetical protein G210_3510, partial [Candida maltosa Xu316]